MRPPVLVAFALLVVTLTGCGQSPSQPTAPDVQQQPIVEPTKPVPEPKSNPKADWTEINRAWAGLGAKAIWFGRAKDGQMVFAELRDDLTEVIPAFQFVTFPGNARWDMLAKPPGPFAVQVQEATADSWRVDQLKDYKGLVALSLGGGHLKDEVLVNVAQLPELIYLGLPHTTLKGPGFKHLHKLKQLRILDVSGCTVFKEVAEQLAGIENLAVIQGGSRYYRLVIPEDAFALIGKLKHITQLHLTNTHHSSGQPITDLKPLSGLTKLKVLKLSYVGLTDEGVACLGQFTALTHLDLSMTKVTGAGLASLSTLPHLTDLSLDSITDNGMKHVGACRNLVRLSVGAKTFPTMGLRHLRDCKTLARLDLWTGDNGDEVLKHLPKLESLAELNLINVRGFTDAGLESVGQLPALRDLNLSVKPITDEGLKHLAGLVTLRVLRLNNCDKLTGSGFQHLSKLKNLEQLWLFNTRVTDAGLEHVAAFTNLRVLHLNAARAVTDAGVKHLRPLAKLEMLDVMLSQVSDASVDTLSELKSLKSINVGLTNVTAAGRQKLQAALPNCQIRQQ